MNPNGILWYRNEFLQSEEWKTFRAQVLADCKGEYFLCSETSPQNDVHHVWYGEPSYTGQRQFLVLCRECHKIIHELYPPTRAYTEADKIVLWSAVKKLKGGMYVRRAKRHGKPWSNCSGCGRNKAFCSLVNPITGKFADGYEPHSYMSLCLECFEAIQQTYGFLEHGTSQRWKAIKEFLQLRKDVDHPI